MRQLIIGITGRAASGKTTVADSILEEAWHRYGLSAEKYELSSYVLAVAIESGLIKRGRHREDLTNDEVGVLISVGQGRRKEDPAFWIKKMEVEFLDDNASVAVIPNVRAQNEAEWVRNHGGVIVNVKAINPTGTEYICRSRDPNDELESSSYLIKPDYWLTAPKGEPKWLKALAGSLFDYLWEKA